jgi:glycosyltransferase involved in cell wall biosynthesis
MKILCVVPSYSPAFQYGGPIFSLHALNKALAQKGIDVTVYTTNVGLKSENIPIKKEIDMEGVRVVYFPFLKFFEILGATGWQLSCSLTMALHKNVRFFDVVYILGIWNYPCLIAGYFCRKYRKPYVVSPRGHLFPYSFKVKSFKKWLCYLLFAKRNIINASAIHYTSQDEAEESRVPDYVNKKSFIVPCGLFLSDFSNLPPKQNLRYEYPLLKDKKVILFLSRIDRKKGVDILINAYIKLTRERQDVSLLIAGPISKKMKAPLEDLLKGGGLEGKVFFTGLLSGARKMEAYTGSDMFVLPSYSESFGMVVIEAMACGLPVIISDKVGIHKEIKENNAGLIITCNADSLYRGIKTLLDNPQLAETLAANARSMLDRYYNIEVAADSLIDKYRRILSSAVY